MRNAGHLNDDRANNISNKNLGFWKWVLTWKGNTEESKLDKIVPGLASIAAILGFLIQEYVSQEKFEDYMNGVTFTHLLQIINAIVIIYILLYGFKRKRHRHTTHMEQTAFHPINYKHCNVLLKQFGNNVKYFFLMTLLLYAALMFDTFNNQSNDNKKYDDGTFKTILSSVIDIEDGLATCQDTASLEYTLAIRNNLEQLKKLIQHEIFKSKKDTISYANNMLKVEGHINQEINALNNIEGVDKSAINKMYNGYYVLKGALATSEEKQSHAIEIISHVIQLLISNFGALFLMCAFLVLYSITLDKESEVSFIKPKFIFNFANIEGDEETKINIANMRNVFVTVRVLKTTFLIVVLLFIGQVIFEFASIDKIKNHHDWFNIFRAISGIFNALAMSLLIARFESVHFQSNLSILACLYLYAIIQAYYGLFDIVFLGDQYIIQEITTTFAFVGKCLLYLYILWIYSTDRLFFYFYQKTSDDKGNGKQLMDWENFLIPNFAVA